LPLASDISATVKPWNCWVSGNYCGAASHLPMRAVDRFEAKMPGA
jgi:hypothetical protein